MELDRYLAETTVVWGANSGVKNFNLKVSRDKHPNVLFERVPYIKN